MRLIADLHIHSRFSTATSQSMDLRTLALYSRVKGLDLLGTGDALHHSWRDELNSELQPVEDTGLYVLRDSKESKPYFLVSVEVSTVYDKAGKTRKIHHVILMPDLAVASQIADVLKKKGNIDSDGRPTLNIDSPSLVETVKQISQGTEILPAHAWTPWFSVFGSKSGFDTLEDCYEDQLKHIHALETGLSSDPPMNWRLSKLDKYTLMSNSDCHSPHPHRLGREANIFELPQASYENLVNAIRRTGRGKLVATIETRPEYGKYHWTGHRGCGVSVPPSEAIKLNNRCPRCGRMLTLGVEQRVEHLADRLGGYIQEGAPGYTYLMPLHELLSTVTGASSVFSKKVQEMYTGLVNRFGSEYKVMLDAAEGEILQVAGEEVSAAVSAVRSNKVRVTPGYDGVYGVVNFPKIGVSNTNRKPRSSGRLLMDDFFG